jgi:hypothetical protein
MLTKKAASSSVPEMPLYHHEGEGNGSGDLKGVLKAQEDAGRKRNLVIHSIDEVRWLSSGWHKTPLVISHQSIANQAIQIFLCLIS